MAGSFPHAEVVVPDTGLVAVLGATHFAFRLHRLKIGQNGLARNRALTDADEGGLSGRQINVDARSETDEPESLADA